MGRRGKLNTLELEKKDYEGRPTTLCAGCGHNSISNQIVEVAWKMGIPQHDIVKFSGIGCRSMHCLALWNQKVATKTRFYVHRLAELPQLADVFQQNDFHLTFLFPGISPTTSNVSIVAVFVVAADASAGAF